MDDISEWLDPPPLKRTSPDSNLNAAAVQARHKTPRIHLPQPCFLRNQSVEGLESDSKRHDDLPPFCRPTSIPHCLTDSDSDDDETDDVVWPKHFNSLKKLDKMDVDETPKNIVSSIVKKGGLLSKKSSYDVTDVKLRNTECLTNERKIPEVDCRRFNIDHMAKSPIMAEGIKNIPKTLEQKPAEKTGFFTKKLLSPKLSRLFKPNSAEVVRNKHDTEENKEERSRSKFFIQRPASPSTICRTAHRVRPIDDKIKDQKLENHVLKSDIKLASTGKPMTPIFRRHIPERPDFADGRFSYRDRRTKYDKTNQEPKFVDVGRNRIKTPINSLDKSKLISSPLIRSSQTSNIPALATVPEKKHTEEVKKREPGISRSNYVSLANLKINSKKDLEKVVNAKREAMSDSSPVERVI